ncbi:MAG: hypothetical protein CMH57_03125, partial [Myxococcales bacterium]|nr:hypothetical protein [Myxococcales bacterium]
DQLGALNNLGNCYAAVERFEEAIATFEKVAHLYPDQPEAYNNIGAVYEARSDHRHAEACYQDAIGVDASHPAAYFNLGSMLANTKRFTESVAYYEQYLTHAPDAQDRTKVESRIQKMRSEAGFSNTASRGGGALPACLSGSATH